MLVENNKEFYKEKIYMIINKAEYYLTESWIHINNEGLINCFFAIYLIFIIYMNALK